MKHQRKGLTFFEFLIIGSLIALIVLVFYPNNFIGIDRRSRVSGVKSDQRSLATGLEAYYVDQNTYPPYIHEGGEFIMGGHLTTPVGYLTGLFVDRFKYKEYNNIFHLLWGEYGALVIFSLTGMIFLAYVLHSKRPDIWDDKKIISHIFKPGIILIILFIFFSVMKRENFDGYNKIKPEWKDKDRGFRYYTDGNGWIVISVGPDGDYDFDPVKYYNSSIIQPSYELLCIAVTYDPTNGTISNGDVYRVKQ